MNLPQAVLDWCRQNGHGEVTAIHPVGGGCINNGMRLDAASGHTFFMKWNPSAPPDMFEREAEGLRALNLPDGPRVPEAFLSGETFLVLEDLAPARPQKGYWEAFGRRLAALHTHHGPSFGFEHDNYLGSTPQPNAWEEDGYAFFAERRLRFQAQLALHRRLIDRPEAQRVDALADRLSALIPEQPPSMIHGDLWSGNAISDAIGAPAMIDPAAHYGWAEAELGMTALFGGFPETFYAAYEEARPLAPGWRGRLPIYNLYHLLNHLNLFGRSYSPQVRSVLNRYL